MIPFYILNVLEELTDDEHGLLLRKLWDMLSNLW